MFISDAFAAGGSTGTSMGELIIQLGLILMIFYFLIILPQQKQAKKHREMIKNLKKGDKIITSGGILAKVVKAEDPLELTVEIADGVNVNIARYTIKEIIDSEAGKNVAGKINAKVQNKKPANSNKKK